MRKQNSTDRVLGSISPFAIRTLVLCIVITHTLGCWGTSDTDVAPDMEPKELTTKEESSSEKGSEVELAKLGKKLYQVGMYSVARDSFTSLRDHYPLGAYSTFAHIKAADTYFFNRQYNEAAKNYDNFIKNYPGHSDTPYVKLQAARSHIASARGTGRDRTPLERGLLLYDELVTEYPTSAYGAIAKQERILVVEQLASYDQEIIDFYRKQGNEAAVADRERQFQAKWGNRLPLETQEAVTNTSITQMGVSAEEASQ